MAQARVWNATPGFLYVTFKNHHWKGGKYVEFARELRIIHPFTFLAYDNFTDYLNFTVSIDVPTSAKSSKVINWYSSYQWVVHNQNGKFGLSEKMTLWDTKANTLMDQAKKRYKEPEDFMFYVDTDLHYIDDIPSPTANQKQQRTIKASNLNRIKQQAISNSGTFKHQYCILCGDYMEGYDDDKAYSAWKSEVFDDLSKRALPTFVNIGNHDVEPGHPWLSIVELSGKTISWQNAAKFAGLAWNNDTLDPATGKKIKANMRGGYYSWFKLHDVYFYITGLYPNSHTQIGLENMLSWLRSDLKKRSTSDKIVIVTHYNLIDDHSQWWDDNEKIEFYDTICDYNVIGIFCGHNHSTKEHDWKPEGKERSFKVYRVGGDKIAAVTLRNGTPTVEFI